MRPFRPTSHPTSASTLVRRFSPLLPIGLVAVIAVTSCDDPGTQATGPEIEAPGPVPPTLDRRTSMEVEGYPTTGPIRSGFIRNRYGQPIEVTYEIHNGQAIWQGDIIIGRPEEIATSEAQLVAAGGADMVQGVVVNDDGSNRWPGGVIPYTITDANTTTILNAIDMIEDQTPGVTLIPRTTETNYVTFRDDTGCSSRIGVFGGQQFINVSVASCSTGNAAHEILHALGLYHEQSRCDRDNWVTIDFTEVQSGKEGNFWKAGAPDATSGCVDATDVGTYDYGSMMHYSAFAWAIGSNPTITAIQPLNGAVMGQRSRVGPTDAATIDLLYGSNNAPPVPVTSGPTGNFLEGSVLHFDASASTDADDDDDILTFSWTFDDGTCSVAFPPLACSDADPYHAYADNGMYTYGVTVSDGFDMAVDGASLSILNVAPIVDAGPDVVVESGQTYDFSGTFGDPGLVDDPWTWVLDWDFGTDDSGSTDDQSAAIEASRQVCAVGDYTVTLTVTDKDGGVGMDDLTLSVPYVDFEIDILPGSLDNPLNLRGNGSVPVAILGSADLDVTKIDPSTLTLGDGIGPDTPVAQKNNGTYSAHLEDVDKDGRMDLVVTFPKMDLVQNGDLTALSTELVLRGSLTDGCTSVRGTDNVTVL